MRVPIAATRRHPPPPRPRQLRRAVPLDAAPSLAWARTTVHNAPAPLAADGGPARRLRRDCIFDPCTPMRTEQGLTMYALASGHGLEVGSRMGDAFARSAPHVLSSCSRSMTFWYFDVFCMCILLPCVRGDRRCVCLRFWLLGVLV